MPTRPALPHRQMLTFLVACLAVLAILSGQREAQAQLPCPPCADHFPPGSRHLGTAASGPREDGSVEAIVAYFTRDPTFTATELGRVGALAVRYDGVNTRVYPLGEEHGEYPLADLWARDLNGDGAPDLAIRGGVGAHSQVMRIYRWSGAGYALLGDFFADSGLGLDDLDGDGVQEVLVGTRFYDRAQLRAQTVMRWDGQGYRAAYQRLGFTFDPAFAQDYPETAVLQYYLAIARKDYRAAYALLGGGMRSGQSYERFVQGFATTVDLRVEDLEVEREEVGGAVVRVELSTLESNGASNRYGGAWTLDRASGAWLLVGAYITPR